MATHALVMLRQSLQSYFLALSAIFDYLRHLVGLALQTVLSKATLAPVETENGKGAVEEPPPLIKKDPTDESVDAQKPKDVIISTAECRMGAPDAEALLAKLSVTFERIADLRHKTSAMLHRKEEIMPAPLILKEVLPRVSSPKVLKPLPEERQLSLDMRKDEGPAEGYVGQLDDITDSAGVPLEGHSRHPPAVVAPALRQGRPLVTVERLGSSAGDESELRRESTKAMQAQEKQGPLPSTNAAAGAAAAIAEAPITPSAATSRAPAAKLGFAGGDAHQEPDKPAGVAAVLAQPPGPADTWSTESHAVTAAVPLDSTSASGQLDAVGARPSPAAGFGGPAQAQTLAHEGGHQPSNVPSSTIAEPDSSKLLPETSLPSSVAGSLAQEGRPGQLKKEAGFWGKLGHTLKKAFTPPESYD